MYTEFLSCSLYTKFIFLWETSFGLHDVHVYYGEQSTLLSQLIANVIYIYTIPLQQHLDRCLTKKTKQKTKLGAII